MTQGTLFNSETKSQEAAILKHLESGRTITALEAFKLYGCLRLSGRIYDLKEQGYKIKPEMIQVGPRKRVARYKLVS